MKRFFKRLYKIIQKPEMRILPGQLAFFLVLSIIPLVALIATISANFSLSIESLMEIINDSLPKEIASFINAAIDGKSMNLNIAIFYISAFILASNGPHSMIIGANMIYKVESKDYITRRIKAIIMTIILVILLLFMLIVPAYGDTLISLLGEVIKAEPIITPTARSITFPFDIKLLNSLKVFFPFFTVSSGFTFFLFSSLLFRPSHHLFYPLSSLSLCCSISLSLILSLPFSLSLSVSVSHTH